MNPLRRSFLKLFGGAALSVPTKAFAQPIRILPDGDTVKPAPIAGQASPELHRTLGAVVPGPATTQGALSTIWLEAAEGRPPAQILTLDEGPGRVRAHGDRAGAGQRARADRRQSRQVLRAPAGRRDPDRGQAEPGAA
jgi:hypothetical protein